MTDLFKKSAGQSVAGAVIMMMLGFLAVFLPSVVTRVSVLLGWIMVLSAFAYFAYAFTARNDKGLQERVLIGFFYLFAGLYLWVSSDLELEPLASLVAAIVFVESLLELAIFSELRPLPGSQWILFDAIATFILAYLIWRSWPSSSTQAIGSLIGIKFVVSGFSRLMYSVTVRQSLKLAYGVRLIPLERKHDEP
jgi:uncharacterized membrane protein HdeD (DUF308 family)